MPKRTTLTFTSEDAPQTNEERLFVYYCKFTGKHAFTIDRDINRLPRRRTDGARIVDLSKHNIKLYTKTGPVKLIRRHNGNIEKQYRLNVGILPVAYKCEEEDPPQFIYVLGDAVTTYVNQAVITGDKVLVPPCIRRYASGGTEVRLEIEDRVHRPALVKVTADHVRIHITSTISSDNAQPEILQMMAKALGARLTQLSLNRGPRNRCKFLIVEHLNPQEVFEKLQMSVGRINTATEAENRAQVGLAR